jgi:hypothetical protein
MSGKLSNRERKKIVGDAIKAHEARIQASIDAHKANKDKNLKKREEWAEAQEQMRLQRLANLHKKMVIIFADLDYQKVMLTIVDPSLMKSECSVREKHHVVYGSADYRQLSMKASYNLRGTRLIQSDVKSYTVSTPDGIEFKVVDFDGNVFSFKSLMKYETLVGRTFSNVKIDQYWYDPFKASFDDEAAKFHAELDKLVEADRQHIEGHPELLGEGYIPYHRGV